MTLPVLVVETAHSRYEIDQNEGVYRRTRVHEDANDLASWGVGNAGEPRPYSKIASALEPGDVVLIIHPDGSFVRSTEIQSVTEVPAGVAA